MTERKLLTSAEISEVFFKVSRKQIAEMTKSGAGAVLGALSSALRALQHAGIDISVDLHKGQYSDAYDMMFTALKPKAGYIPVYGFVQSGNAVKLLAIVTQMDDTNVCKVLLSEHVSGENNSRISWSSSNNAPAAVFHFDQEENALASLQKAMISFAAGTYAVKSFDGENVFGKAAPESKRLSGKYGLRRPNV
jgi:hypothetical protein